MPLNNANSPITRRRGCALGKVFSIARKARRYSNRTYPPNTALTSEPRATLELLAGLRNRISQGARCGHCDPAN